MRQSFTCPFFFYLFSFSLLAIICKNEFINMLYNPLFHVPVMYMSHPATHLQTNNQIYVYFPRFSIK